MNNKKTFVNRVLKGGLSNKVQRYKITFLPEESYVDKLGKEIILTKKVAIEHRIELNEDDPQRFFSIRFSEPDQLLDFVGHCISAFIYFKMNTEKNYNADIEISKLKESINFYIAKGGKNG